VLLQDEGYEVVAVASGVNAVAEAQDFVLLVKMPRQDGLETLAKIRARGIRRRS
jgi:CheY-like chemotaxis protein